MKFPIRHNELVKLVEPDARWDEFDGYPKIGTKGTVVSFRQLGDSEPKYLVKFRGYRNPISLNLSQIDKVGDNIKDISADMG